MERAKEIFLRYNGNHFFMDHDGVSLEYDKYHISKETEEIWRREYVSGLIGKAYQGKNALKAYTKVTELLKSDRSDKEWEEYLYYPLNSDQLDDVTILFMLQKSFHMAERAAKKHRFSPQEASAYINALNIFAEQVQGRANAGTVSRAPDYVKQEFSDPVYLAYYLDELKKKWNGLFQ